MHRTIVLVGLLALPACETYTATCKAPGGVEATITATRLMTASATEADGVCGASIRHTSDPQTQGAIEAIRTGFELGQRLSAPPVGSP